MSAFTVPEFFRSSAGTYWHRPRSASRQTWGWSWRAWCGGTATSGIVWSNDPGENLCGTCDGRLAGSMPEGDLIFTPRASKRPTRCPGSNRMDDAFVKIGARVGRCLVCGNAEPLRSKGGAHDPREGLATHAPGDGIDKTRCDEHGWSDLTLRDGRVECRCGPVGGDLT